MLRLERASRVPKIHGVTPTVILGLLLFAAALVFLAFWGNQLAIKPCLLKMSTGIPCFLCGGTRSSVALFRGDVSASMGWNPLVLCGLLVGAIVIGLRFGLGQALRLGGSRRLWWTIGIVVVAANWIYVITTQGIG